jgi:ATP-binding cassette subfamily B protein
MVEVWGEVMRASGAAERLLELLQIEHTIVETNNPKQLSQPKKAEIEFHRVSFHYPSRQQSTALDNINLTIAPGESIALVGHSGAGKTTLFQLLLRFYDVSHGSIRFNGQDIRQLSLQELHHKIAIVPQDSVIFSANALDNIRYGCPTATDEEVRAAARAAQVEEFINGLPEGYHPF